jgi:hypothetical protein
MKQQDIALLIVIGFVSGVASFFLSGWLFGGEKAKMTVSRIDEISSEFTQPDTKYFNTDAINPTINIRIGDKTNNDPFGNN